MSAEISDVARIQDEDVLRRMWQETDDFGRKKEIRSHMYKLREARLKEFYNSSDVTNEVCQSSTQKVSSKMSTTHADALADQSYVTLKSKEVRDSESPTRDAYKAIKLTGDQGWNVEHSHQQSDDGKLHTSTHLATSSGTQNIEGGKVNYAAKVEEKSSVFQDGDDKCFTRAAGTSSQSVIHQEATGGDESSHFRSSSSKTSSSSRYMSETKSSTEVPSIDETNAKSVVQKTYTSNAPNDVKSHPSYVEGKTKVTQETKTLADGTVVTTTRYETKEGNSTRSATHKKYSNVATASRQSEDIRNVVDTQISGSKTLKESSRKLEETPTTYNSTTRITKTPSEKIEYVEIPLDQYITKSSSTSVQQDFSDTKQSTQTSKMAKKPEEVSPTTKITKTPQDKIEYVDQFITKSTSTRAQQDSKKSVDQFIATERQREVETRAQAEISSKPTEKLKEPAEPYVQPDRRQPIRPGESELNHKPSPTEGQYSTTYRSEFTNKKISVEVSATHDAFARSLRSVTPERISKNSPRCSSNSSLRSTTSPDKHRYPSRSSPDRSSRSRSPKKFCDRFASNETVVYTTNQNRKSPDRFTSSSKTVSDDSRKTNYYSSDTITRKSKTVDNGTITHKSTRPRSPSPTETTTSDFEYRRTSKDVTTDLDMVDSETVINKRPSSLDISTRKTKKVTERSPTSPLSPQKSPVKEERPRLIRTDTYEERVKEILGLTNKEVKETRRSSLERNSLKRSSLRSVGSRTTSSDDVVKRLTKSSPRTSPEKLRKSPEKSSPTRPAPGISEFPSQIRKSPEKALAEKTSPTKHTPNISEFPAQGRKSPEKVSLEPYPQKKIPEKQPPSISEFPSQIRKSTERIPLEPYPEKSSPEKHVSTISEFPAQIRKSPERLPSGPCPEKSSPSRQPPSVSEFPAQIRKSPERSRPASNIGEFPSQIKKSPERTPSETNLEKSTPKKSFSPSSKTRPEKEKSTPAKGVSEFPSQVRKSPERVPLEQYPEKLSPAKQASTISEFPSQIRKSPEKEPLQPYPEKQLPSKQPSSISEFPSQVRKSPERVPLEPYPEKLSPTKQALTISEFPKSPEKEPLQPYPEKSPPNISEFPSQVRKSPERAPVEPYPEKSSPKKDAPCVSEFPAQIRKSPGRVTSQVRKSPERVTFDLPETKKLSITEDRNAPARLSSVLSQSKKTKTSSESSTTSEVEELSKKTTRKSVETRIPVSEPVVEKKIFSQLCKADEKRVTSSKKQTQKLIETERGQNKKPVNGVSKPKGPSKITPISTIPKKPADKVSPKKPVQATITSRTIPTKKSPIIPSNKKQPQTIYKVEKSKFVGQTEYQDEFSKVKQVEKKPLKKTTLCHIEVTDKLAKITKKPQKKTTFHDVEVSSRLTDSKSARVRTNRVDDTVTKKKVSKTVTLNGNVTKKSPVTATSPVVKKSSAPKSKPCTKQPESSKTTTCCSKTTKKIQETHGYTSSEESDLESLEGSFIDLTDKRDQYLNKKESVITTKTVLINNNDDLNREVIVNLQRSKSSREPTPDRLCPRPLTSDEEEDSSPVRYPDQISEPDERKPKKLTDLPIFESDDNLEESRIVDVTEAVAKITKVDRVEETDESLLSVDKKIHKFLNTADKLTKEPVKPRPAKVDRPVLQVTEDLREDDCLLSVSDKVSKFISTAEKLTSTTLPEKPKSPGVQRKSPRQSPEREATFTKTKSSNQTVTEDFLHKEQTQEMKTRKSVSISPERSPSPGERTPNRRLSNQYISILRKESTGRSYDRETSPETPKSSRRLSQEDSKISTTTRLRSNESIKKAKALFENISKEDTKWKKDVVTRPSVVEVKKLTGQENEEVTRRSSLKSTTEDRIQKTSMRRTPSPKKSPERKPSSEKIEITRFRSRSRSPEAERINLKSATEDRIQRSSIRRTSSPKKSPSPDKIEITRFRSRSRSPETTAPGSDVITAKLRSREPTPDGDLPHYMKPLDRNLRVNSPHRDNLVDQDTRQSKFGVTLRKIDHSATETSTSINERRKSSITLEKRITEEEVEEIFDLEILEELLEKVVGYELRRKIRTQIRLVKRLITEGTLEEYISKRTARRGSSPLKSSRVEKTEYIRKSSPERKSSGHQIFEHSDLVERRSSVENTTEYKSSYSANERKSSSTRSSLSPERRKTPSGQTTTTTTVESIPGGTRTTTTKTTEKSFVTLKKTAPPAKTPVENSQPEWVRQRNLRNSKENATITTKKTASTSYSTSKKERTSPVKETKGTDLITSSYGVGPTDENGTPLFGLRALRAQNKNEQSKVQGTVIRSEYYSENDQEPVGQVSVTKYSTDPRDLDQEGVVSTDGKVTSVTTTQKFGYKDTPSLKSLTGNKKEICDTTEKTTKAVSRRGSVKEISKKFIDNAVETIKSEKQTVYPKAGLILRSSSFKGTNGEVEVGSPEPGEIRTCSVTKVTTSTGGETFLSNKSKITDVQDVLTRMKNEDTVEGESEEDIAARGLLNKFIGSQVILSGMEACAKASKTKTATSTTISPTVSIRRTTKITTTITEEGKPTTKTRIFQRPVTEKELETVWDEQSLRLLLEQSTDYEERRIIRARLRQIMAELEACTALVDDALKGEEPKTPTTPTGPGQLEGECQLLPLLQGLLDAPENDITPDSGTESGEDQRSSLIAEVQTALEKLSNSLKSDQTDITPERRSSLLQLVTKLQAGLSGNTATERRASTVSAAGRFQKRKNKQSRHTVGVSKEELADARKLIEQISLNDLTQADSCSKLSKQNSESSVPNSSASSSYRNVHQKVKNATAKPFSSSNSTTSSVQTPTEHLEGLDDDSPQQKTSPKPLERNVSVDSNVSIKSACQAVQKAAASKLMREQSKEQSEAEEEEEEEDEASTVKGASDLENAPLRTNPIYSRPSGEEKCSRFDTQKKLKMKRANTIDIPKPLLFYEDEDDSDDEHDDRRRESCQPLRGPLNVGNPHTKKIVPTFQPRTESDKKFLAFINKHQEGGANRGAMWGTNSSVWGNRFGSIKNTFENKTTPQQDAKSFWKSADDNIKKSTANQFGPRISRRSARNLQQMFEEKQKESLRSAPAPKPQHHNHQIPQQKFEQNPKENIKSAPVSKLHQNVVTGSLQVKTEPEKQYRVVPHPLPVNQFSHAPQSAFKPIKKSPPSPNKRSSVVFSPDGTEIMKSEIKESGGPAFLYSPKPLSSSSSTVTSPVSTKPWTAAPSGRVLSLAASKFEQPPPEPPKPRKSSKGAIAPPGYANTTVPNRNREFPRKLSQDTPPQTYQVKTSVVESQFVPPVKVPTQQPQMPPPQNYSIRYDQPQNYSIRYDQSQNRGVYPQNYSIRYDQPQSQHITPQNYSIRYDQPAETKVVPPTNEKEFTSTCEFRLSPGGKTPPVQAIEPVLQPPKVERQISDESVHEYTAVSSRVMSGPVSQQAVTVKQKAPMSRDQHDMQAAFSLRNSLQKAATAQVSPSRSPSNSFSYKPTKRRSPGLSQSFKYRSEMENCDVVKYHPNDCPKPTVSLSKAKSVFEESHKEGRNCGVVKPMQQQKPIQIYNNTTGVSTRNEKNLSVVTGQFHIPVINVKSPESPRMPSQAKVLSKSDSWHEICVANQAVGQKPSPKSGPVKSKSSNTLSVPKMFEAGMSKEEMLNKRRTMEAFLTGGKAQDTKPGVKRSINRVKTSQKISTQSRTTSGGGIVRSRTLPDMMNPNLLDESNIDRAFEELFESS